MNIPDLILKNGHVLTEGGLIKASIAIKDGVIVAIGSESVFSQSEKTINAEGRIIMPGLIDTHCHFRDPGFTYKEDFESGSRAAAVGGITTTVDMPNTDPPPDTRESFREHRSNAEKKALVDFNHWALPKALEDVQKIAGEGAVGFKFFMKLAHYPYDRRWAITDDDDILQVFKAVSRTGLPCLVHPHNQDIWDYNVERLTKEGKTDWQAWNEATYGDSDIVETTAIARVAILADAAKVKVRVLHVQGRPQLRIVRALKASGYNLVVEANPWGVFQIGPLAIQSAEDLEENWKAYNDGTIDLIASDHAPHTKQESEAGRNDVFNSVIIGYPLCEHYLSMYLTEVNSGRLTIDQLGKLTSTNVAKHLQFYPQKGTIRVGSDADFVVVDLKQERVLGKNFPVYSKMGYSPYEGKKVKGIPMMTIVRGKLVAEDGEILAKPGNGKFIRPVVHQATR